MSAPDVSGPDSTDIERIVSAWLVANGSLERADGAREEDLAYVERVVRRRLPEPLATLYRISDGWAVLGGNLVIERLRGSSALDGLTYGGSSLADHLRNAEWPIAEEVVAFGGNGQGEVFGLWLPRASGAARCPVVQVGAIFEPGCMAVVGTDVVPFLMSWTAYYVTLLEDPTVAWDALDVPSHLRVDPGEATDDYYAVVCEWADPELPRIPPDPYEDRLVADDVRRLLAP